MAFYTDVLKGSITPLVSEKHRCYAKQCIETTTKLDLINHKIFALLYYIYYELYLYNHIYLHSYTEDTTLEPSLHRICHTYLYIAEFLYIDVVPVPGDIPSPRAAHACVANSQGDAFLFGGRHGSQRLNDLYHIDMRRKPLRSSSRTDCYDT